MKKLLISLFMLPVLLYGQNIVGTRGILYTAGVPNNTPTMLGAWIAMDTTTAILRKYNWSTGNWDVMSIYNQSFQLAGNNLQLTDGNGTLDVSLAGYLDNTDDQALSISNDTLFLEDGGFVVLPAGGSGLQWSDTTVLATQYYVNSQGFLTDALQWSDTTVLVTISHLQDTAAAIRGDFPVNTDDQVIDTFDIVTNTLRISLESDAQPFKSVDLSPYLDNTDNQTVDTLSLTGTTLTLALEDDGEAPYTVDLSSLQDGIGTDDQTISLDSTASHYTLSIEDGNSISWNKVSPSGEVNDLTSVVTWANVPDANITQSSVTQHQAALTITESQISDLAHTVNTDDQTVDTLSLTGTVLTLALEGDNEAPYTVDLAGLQDGTGTDDQTVDTLSLTGTVLTLALEDDNEAPYTVDLSGLQDGTGTDDQNLTITGAGPSYVIDIEDGNDVTISAAGIATLSEPAANELRITATEVDGSVTNEIQDFTPADNGTTFSWDLSGATSHPTITEGANITMARTGDDVTISATDTQLSQEQVEDYAGAMVTGNTETLIAVTYQDADGTIDFEVTPTLSSYTNDAGFITSETDDQNLTIGGAGPTYTIDIENGNDVTIEASGITTLSEPSANVLRITTTEVDGSTTNEIQNFTPTDDGTTFSWDLSGATSHPTITEGSNITMSRTGDDVTISATDTQLSQEQVEDYAGAMVSGNTETLIAVTYQDADGTIDFEVTPTLSSYTNDAGFLTGNQTITLSGDVTGSGATAITTTIATGAVGTDELASTAVTPGSYTNASITVDADGRLTAASSGSAGTDDQNLTIGGAGPTYTIDIEDGADVTISAAGIATLSEPSANELRITATEVDGSVSNEGSLTVAAGTATTSLIQSNTSGATDVTIEAAGILTTAETGNKITLTATEAQTFSGSDDGTNFVLDLSGAATDITISEGESIEITRSTTNLTIGTTEALASGTWTPTITSVTNLDGTTAYDGQYMRVGSTVTLSLKIGVDPTAATTYTELRFSLPISSSFTCDCQAAGSGAEKTATVQNPASVYGDSTNDEISVSFRSASTGVGVFYITATYQIL